jgi:hypothetical protein
MVSDSRDVSRPNLEAARVRPEVGTQKCGTESLAWQSAGCGPVPRQTYIDILQRGKVQRRAILERLHKLLDPCLMISILIHGSDCPGLSPGWSDASQCGVPTSPFALTESHSPLITNPCPTLQLVTIERCAVAAASHDQHSGGDQLV